MTPDPTKRGLHVAYRMGDRPFQRFEPTVKKPGDVVVTRDGLVEVGREALNSHRRRG